MPEVQGKLVNLWIRIKGTGPAVFKKLTCTEDSQFQITNEVTKRRTNCGIKTGIADAEFNASGNAVTNVVPTSLEMSYKAVKALQIAKTKVDFVYNNDADPANAITLGEGIDNFGSGYFTETTATATAQADGLLSFGFKFEGTGVLDDYDES